MIAAIMVLSALIAGCATTSRVPGSPSSSGAIGTEPTPAPGPAPPRQGPSAPVVSPLVTEQQWLDEWFRGTPVVIAMPDSNTLAVDVPLANSFAAGSNSIRPALAAVLERVATSLRRQAAMRVSIAAPTDDNGPTALATSRTQQVREYLIARGVASTRTTGLGTARAGTAVQLRMVIVPQAISRLNDATLQVPASGFKPTSAAPVSGTKR